VAAAAAAMPPERKRMAGLWEREVGGLPPRNFANAFMASKVFFPSPSSLITYNSD
jgi:DDB1- and CUL4-associated factor 8